MTVRLKTPSTQRVHSGSSPEEGFSEQIIVGMDPSPELSRARYSRMRWNAPLSENHAAFLVERLGVPPGVRILDLGCGWGELLLRAVAASDADVTGTGVDTDVEALERGRVLAADRGLAGRVRLIEGEAAAWQEPADRILCVGASHALAGTKESLLRLADLTLPGGRVLFGDGFWERPPTRDAATLFGEDVLSFAGVIACATTAGWRVLHASTADQREWDDFESTFRAGREEWLQEHPNDDQAAGVRTALDDQLQRYVEVYRGVFGFCYLILGR